MLVDKRLVNLEVRKSVKERIAVAMAGNEHTRLANYWHLQAFLRSYSVAKPDRMDWSVAIVGSLSFTWTKYDKF